MEILRGTSGDTGIRKIGLTSGTDNYSQKNFVHWPIKCKFSSEKPREASRQKSSFKIF